MIKLKNKTALLIVLASASTSVFAKENVGIVQKAQNASSVLANNCTQSTHLETLSVNNVRTTMRGGGDFWWDGQFAKYEIPAGSGKNSVYAGSIWMGGISSSGNLKVAAMTYRQTGIDYWPGPLDAEQEIVNEVTGDLETNPNYGQTNIDVCTEYNDHYKITLQEVSEYYSNCLNGTLGETQYPNIMEWPGNGVNGELSYMLAPFVDLDGDGIYEPEACEYPAYDLTNSGDCLAKDVLFGDETIFWVFNDRGNIHTESGSESIGVEVQTQAFAFATNDEINDMTFYNYKILNRSVESLNETYFGTWVDSDLGNHLDDYVGCDVARGLGYTYNGDEFDENANGYGANPPAMGLDFFRGPVADANDGIDNDKDGCVDCTYGVDADGNQIEIDDDATPELIIMSKFMFYNNSQDATEGNPDIASDFYNYLNARWKNGNPITYGGKGQEASNPPCDFMFPGDTDPNFPGQNWTEETAGNTPDDRRFIISAGPFTLKPGAVNTITTGVVWARANQGGAFASVEKMRVADDKAQSLFDNCFQVLNGPDAPDLTFDSYDKQFIVTLSNSEQSNNYNDGYEEVDPTLIGTSEYPISSNKYVFEGYQIFQLADENVTSSDLYNLDKARLVHQSDIKNYRADSDSTVSLKNGIANLINYEKNADLDAFVPVNKTIDAGNEGVKHSFTILQDAFAQGDNALINSKTYYYMAIAYGYNEYMPYKPDVPFDNDIYIPNSSGQKYPYKAGRRNIRTYAVRPYSKAGDLAGSYGTIPEMTRIQGNGSNGKALEFTTATEDSLINLFCVSGVTYKENAGPVNIYVIDPSNLTKAKYQFMILPDSVTAREVNDNSNWMLVQNPNTAEADTVYSDQTVGVNNEQIITQWGLAVDVNVNSEFPVESRDGNNGFISSSLVYENPTDQWLTFFQDQESPNFGNWITSGTQQTKLSTAPDGAPSYRDFYSVDAVIDINASSDAFADPKSSFENVINGGWAPYILTNSNFGFPHHSNAFPTEDELEDFRNLPSIKVVFTPNKDLWTRVPVMETYNPSSDPSESTKTDKHIKNLPSLGKDNLPDGSGNGWSWFPGYALDKTSGMRLNMVFGENSNDTVNNGNDMIFNPTHVDIDDETNTTPDVDGNPIYHNLKLGGRHYIYVKNSLYRGDDEKDNPDYDSYQTNLEAVAEAESKGERLTRFVSFIGLWDNVVWAAIPMRVEGNEMNESDVTIDIDVSTPYKSWNNSPELQACGVTEINNSLPVYNFSTSTIEETNIVDDKGLSNEIDLVGVVPNPYYGGSEFETNPIDHKVRITNLPVQSVVSIYTVDGVLVKQVNVEDGRDYDWDLKNIKGLSIASGVYIIHIETPTAERTIKWFGSLRPIDLDTF